MRTTVSAALAVAGFVAASAWAPAAAVAAPHREDPRAGIAVAALDGPMPATMLDDIAAMVGYRPVIVDGLATNPDGECSSPVTLPAEFEPLCRAHDLGYDVLRYADGVGAPLGDWARRTIDGQLDERMDAACDTRTGTFARGGCHTMAFVAGSVVAANSWRQDYAAPAQESPWPYLFAALLGAGLVAGGVAARSATR